MRGGFIERFWNMDFNGNQLKPKLELYSLQRCERSGSGVILDELKRAKDGGKQFDKN